MLVEYAGEAKLYVPLTRLDLVQKYRGAGEGSAPPLDRMGGATWQKTKSRVKARMRDMADELLKLYAARKMSEGFRLLPRLNWQREFEDAFEFSPTKDQTAAVRQIKTRHGERHADGPAARAATWASARRKSRCAPRSRLSATASRWPCSRPQQCSFCSISRRFKRRFQSFPVRVEMLSRFRSPKEIKQTLEELAAGKVDIVDRHAPAAVEGCRVPRPRPAGGGRRAALRRAAQGTAEGDAARTSMC